MNSHKDNYKHVMLVKPAFNNDLYKSTSVPDAMLITSETGKMGRMVWSNWQERN